MDKVKLPKDVDKAINTLRMADISDYGIIALSFRGIDEKDKWSTPSVRKSVEIIRSFTFSNLEDEDIEWKISSRGPTGADKLIIALGNGYEVELTPKEQAIEYLSALSGIYGAYHTFSAHDAIVQIMKILGVKDDA